MGVNGLQGNNVFYSGADPLCVHCRNEVEDTEHYFTQCPAHDAARTDLVSRLQTLGHTDGLSPRLILNFKVQELRDAVFQFIKDTDYTTKI